MWETPSQQILKTTNYGISRDETILKHCSTASKEHKRNILKLIVITCAQQLFIVSV